MSLQKQCYLLFSRTKVGKDANCCSELCFYLLLATFPLRLSCWWAIGLFRHIRVYCYPSENVNFPTTYWGFLPQKPLDRQRRQLTGSWNMDKHRKRQASPAGGRGERQVPWGSGLCWTYPRPRAASLQGQQLLTCTGATWWEGQASSWEWDPPPGPWEPSSALTPWTHGSSSNRSPLRHSLRGWVGGSQLHYSITLQLKYCGMVLGEKSHRGPNSPRNVSWKNKLVSGSAC